MDRRFFGVALLSACALGFFPGAARASSRNADLEPRYMPQTVANPFDEPVGTIVVAQSERYLYLLESRPLARRYGIGVGKSGLAFSGAATIERKAEWPAWRPTANMIKRNPKRYARYAGGMPGGPKNPLGSRALYLFRDGRDTLYRIHGTNEPWTIGQAVSNGCIRMVNEHVEDLYERVQLGARVVVMS